MKSAITHSSRSDPTNESSAFSRSHAEKGETIAIKFPVYVEKTGTWTYCQLVGFRVDLNRVH